MPEEEMTHEEKRWFAEWKATARMSPEEMEEYFKDFTPEEEKQWFEKKKHFIENRPTEYKEWKEKFEKELVTLVAEWNEKDRKKAIADLHMNPVEGLTKEENDRLENQIKQRIEREAIAERDAQRDDEEHLGRNILVVFGVVALIAGSLFLVAKILDLITGR